MERRQQSESRSQNYIDEYIENKNCIIYHWEYSRELFKY